MNDTPRAGCIWRTIARCLFKVLVSSDETGDDASQQVAVGLVSPSEGTDPSALMANVLLKQY